MTAVDVVLSLMESWEHAQVSDLMSAAIKAGVPLSLLTKAAIECARATLPYVDPMHRDRCQELLQVVEAWAQAPSAETAQAVRETEAKYFGTLVAERVFWVLAYMAQASSTPYIANQTMTVVYRAEEYLRGKVDCAGIVRRVIPIEQFPELTSLVL